MAARPLFLSPRQAACVGGLALVIATTSCPSEDGDPIVDAGAVQDSGSAQPACATGFALVEGGGVCIRWQVVDEEPPGAVAGIWRAFDGVSISEDTVLLQDHENTWTFETKSRSWTGPVPKALDRRGRLHMLDDGRVIDYEAAGHPQIQTLDACSSTVAVLDLATLVWSTHGAVPFEFPPGRFGSSARLGSRLYVHGGQPPCKIDAVGRRQYLDENGDEVPVPDRAATTRAFSLDAETLEWHQEPSSPAGFSSHVLTRTASGSFVFAAGGAPFTYIEEEPAQRFGAIDATTLEWLEVRGPESTGCLHHTMNAVALHDDVVLAGGACQFENALYRFDLPGLEPEVFLPDSWKDFAPASAFFKVLVVGDEWALVLPYTATMDTQDDEAPASFNPPPPLLVRKSDEAAFALPPVPEAAHESPGVFRGVWGIGLSDGALFYEDNPAANVVLLLELQAATPQ